MSIRIDEPLYTKVGKRYKEVGRRIELDLYRYNKDNPETPSAALLVFQKHSTSYLRNVDIDSAGLAAAMRVANKAMVEAMVEKSKLKPSQPPKEVTQEQRDLLDKLEITGFNTGTWHWESISGVVDAGIKVLEDIMGGYEMKIKEVAIPKLVYGVGINDADYVTQKFETIIDEDGKKKQRQVWICPFYRAWKNMLIRCYSLKAQERNPTYKGCSVSEEWKTFSNFRAWMVIQDWGGKQLDKDLLVEGNKVYSAETCVFVSRMVNTFTTDSGATRGGWLIGVYWHKRDNKFASMCRNPFTKKQENLGYFSCEQEAHNEWLKRKRELAKELAATQTDERVAKALIERYTNYKTNN